MIDSEEVFGLGVAALFALAVVWLGLFAGPARGQTVLGMHHYADDGVCPAHRPHKRLIQQYPTMTTLGACPPRLVCGPEWCKQEQVISCHRLPEPVEVEICLTDGDLARAK